MFEVELYKGERSWYGLKFEFDSLEEAQMFIKTALEHFIKKDGDEDEYVLVAFIKYSQRFTTAEEETDENR